MQQLANVTALGATALKPAVEVRGLSHVYAGRDGNVPALSDIALTVGAGRFVVIVGPSGCGKTSLLMMLAGLRAPSAGTILCDGRPIPQPDPIPRRRRVPGGKSLSLAHRAGKRRISAGAQACAARGAASRAPRPCSIWSGLAGFGGRYPHELSGGMKQRVSIARGLVQDPPVLLMDEPFAALDEQTRMTMGHELLRIWEQTAKTVVFITHSLTEAVYLADEVVVMSARPGRILDRVEIALPRPRTYQMMATDVFGTLRERIWQQIRTPAS